MAEHIRWDPAIVAGANDVLRGSHPGAAAALGELVDMAWMMSDQELVALALTRIAQLLGCEDLATSLLPPPASGRDADKRRSVATWPMSAIHTERERACLAFVEQLHVDPAGVDQRISDAVLVHLSERELLAFASAVYVLDSHMRVLAITAQFAAAAPADLERRPS